MTCSVSQWLIWWLADLSAKSSVRHSGDWFNKIASLTWHPLCKLFLEVGFSVLEASFGFAQMYGLWKWKWKLSCYRCWRSSLNLRNLAVAFEQLLESSSMHIHYCKSIENAVTSWAYLLRLAESQFYTNTSTVARTAELRAAVGWTGHHVSQFKFLLWLFLFFSCLKKKKKKKKRAQFDLGSLGFYFISLFFIFLFRYFLI